MDLSTTTVDELAAQVAAADAVVAVGAGTHREVGGPVPTGLEVRAPAGVVAYDPAELMITVHAGTSMAELDSVLTPAGQMCPFDPRDSAATVGGVLASGLSGPRRLRYGPLRDALLEVRIVTADGRRVRGGAPVVKNVTGFDLPRLLVGSLGTLAVIVQATVRCRPRPQASEWTTTSEPPGAVRARVLAPSVLLWDGAATHASFEGDVRDVQAQLATIGGTATERPPDLPDGPHRGRVSVRPGAIVDVGRALDAIAGCRWLAEGGVGTVHVATDTPEALLAARATAQRAGGWLLREAGGGAGFDGFGRELPEIDVARRLKRAFDPTGKLSPGRLPL
jgi:glycolate oxidase FAD binding subunit